MKYSIVIPLKNEEDNINDLINEIEPVMVGLNAPWEVICIDDGSTDKTFDLLSKLCQDKPFLRAIAFDRNYGQSCAFEAGFKNARGEWIITMDGDRQNDPSDIPKLLEKTTSADLICGIRVNRQDPWHKKITSKLANFVRSRLCHDDVKDTGCSLKVYRSQCLNSIKMYKGMHRFLPALFKIEGFNIAQVPVSHRERIKGTTKYNFFNRSFNTIADMMAVRWMSKRHVNYHIKKELP